ncbi:LUD domain-containing protein [Halobium salinum]|uniref:LUD domain-containing protein n=1 Tax=Halobium salinum TaxID=1364940 RepID=A0ABD5PJ04_9EURY|nr:LUD domain-containing protein [Halobium salinum]
MSATRIAEFGESLEAHGVSWARTDADGFASTLVESLVEPAVGVPLGYEGVSLDDAPVTVDPTPAELRAATTGVTPVRLGVAAYGSFLVDSDAKGSEPVSLYPERHVAVVRGSDLVADLPAALDELGASYAAEPSSAVFATGPSATGDMGALVEGVHGPKHVHAVVLEDR